MVILAAFAGGGSFAVALASFGALTLSTATPLVFGALAGIASERSGVANIAVEGMLLAGAFFGHATTLAAMAAGAQGLDPLLWGVAAAAAAGGLVGALLWLLTGPAGINHLVAGVAVNILAAGLTGYLQRILLPRFAELATGTLPQVAVPLLSRLPVAGVLFHIGPLTLAALLAVPLAQALLDRTAHGLRTRAAGENPEAATAAGIDVSRLRLVNLAGGGCLAGLGGAYLTLESVPVFESLMTGGRGFIALAAVIFGGWRPWGALRAALLFGAASALQVTLQFQGDALPASLSWLASSHLLGMVPYLLTMAALCGLVGRSTPPAALGGGG
jgi:simple sugar transport system permease protein